MKKKHVTWIILAALVVLAALLWHSYLTDPLASFKEATVEVIEKQTDLQKFMDSVMSAAEQVAFHVRRLQFE